MEDISKYIGIPHIFAEWSLEGCDCVGLVRRFYVDHHWKPDCDDGEFAEDWYITDPRKMIRYLRKNFNKVKDIADLSFGDVCYFLIGGEGHCGIYLGYGKLLTTFPSTAPQWNNTVLPDVSMILHRDVWEQGYRCGFHRKE
jgi:cell wall-associated NlpC family hydrolase